MMKKLPKIIAILGMPGSGKGTVVSHLENSYNLPKIYFGGMVYEEVERRGLDHVLDERMVREDMRTKEGPAVLAKRAAAKAHEHFEAGAKQVVFDGLYSWSEDKFLREEFGEDIITVAVVINRALRYERVVARKDAHRPYTLGQIQLRDIEEIENLEKGGPIAYADYFVLNNGTTDELLAQVDAVVK